MQYILELHKEDTFDCEMFGVLSTPNILQHGCLACAAQEHLVDLQLSPHSSTYSFEAAAHRVAAHRVAVSLMAVL